ncbi:TPA: toxin-antitoxin system HicB family antitoxin [Burkholderia cenocepacia]|nr:toxin-antitoxin system HicB family antitoxin [Burkholderia cenocepacia]
MNTMHYKGYTARIDVDGRDDFIVGWVPGVAAIARFQGASVAGLRRTFEAAVDAFLADCAERGIALEACLLAALTLPVRPEIDAAISAVVPAIGKIVNLQADEALAQSQDCADIERIAAAIEADAGEPLPELRQALAEA